MVRRSSADFCWAGTPLNKKSREVAATIQPNDSRDAPSKKQSPDMPDKASVETRPNWMSRLKQVLVPTAILLMAAGIVFLIVGNWNTWASDRGAQQTDDAYVRADVTPLSTKVAGLVATVHVSDYQAVKSGQLLVELRD